MNLFEENNNWSEKLQPILNKYKGRRHPLNYNNLYQLMIMVILSARDSDLNINNLALNLFKNYPDLQSIANDSLEGFTKQITSVTNYNNKANWIFEIATTLKKMKIFL